MSLTNPSIAPVLPGTLLIVGAGGHARVVADAALCAGQWGQFAGWDRDPARCIGELQTAMPMLDEANARQRASAVHVAIGDNRFRAREVAFWAALPLVSVVHPAAQVSRFAQLGDGCFVAAGAIVASHATVGEGGIVNHGAVVDHDVQIGSFCHVAPNATLGGAVRLGHRVLVGAAAVVLPGVAIADDVIVGAGAVVRTDLTESGTYVGVPARRVQ